MVSSVNNNTAANIGDNPYLMNEIKSASNAAARESESSIAGTAAFALGSTAVFEGVPFYLYCKNNKKLNGSMTKDMVELSKSTQAALTHLRNGDGSIFGRLKQYFNVINDNNKAYSDIRSLASNKVKAEKLAQKAKNAVEQAAKNPEKYPQWKLDRILKQSAEMNKKAAEVIKPGTINGGEKFSIGKLCRASGAKALFILSGLIEGVMEIYPTFKELGAESGIRQLGKSTVKIAGDTVGFIAGQQVGMAVGSAIGTALFPGVGTVIGGAVGLVTGFGGSYLAEKVTSKIIGKSELELAEERKNENQKNNFSMAA